MGFAAFDSFQDSVSNGGHVPYPKSTETVQGGHAVTIVGYDEKKDEDECYEGDLNH